MTAKVYDFGVALVCKELEPLAFAFCAGRPKWLVHQQLDVIMNRLGKVGYSERYIYETLKELIDKHTGKQA